MYGRFSATSITLRRLTSCMDSTPIKVMLVETLKGKTDTDWFFNQNDRKCLAYAIFDCLSAEGTLTYVLGNIGFALSSFIQERMFDHIKDNLPNMRSMLEDQLFT